MGEDGHALGFCRLGSWKVKYKTSWRSCGVVYIDSAVFDRRPWFVF